MKTLASYVVRAFLVLPGLLGAQARPSSDPLSNPGGLLSSLAGMWHVDLYAASSTKAIASGQREMRLSADSMKLTWTETFGGHVDTGTGPHASTGILGYNSATAAYYVLGALTNEPSPLVLIGRPDSSGHTIVFDLASTDLRLAKPGIYVPSELRLIDADHFEWVASDSRGRAAFRRVGRS